MENPTWHTLSIERVYHDLKTSEKGMSNKQAVQRLEHDGPNELPEEKIISPFRVFFEQFKSTLIVILLVAMAISFVLGEFIDGYVILAAIVLNVIIGFVQEVRAERALEKLRKIVTFKATVRRDGHEIEIDSVSLVVGDVVILRAGNRVPADIRLTRVSDLHINEAPLTGESSPVEKTNRMLPSAVIVAERKNSAFFGTTVVRGTAEGVIVAIGIDTEIGKIAQMLKSTKEEPTPLQRKMTSFSRLLGFIILGISLLLFLIGIAAGYDVEQMFITAVAVAVAAVPEGLVVIMTVILAIGMQRILRQGSLVRKLVAAETLGSTTVICTDKTGTLTEGVMRVVKVVTHDRHTDMGPVSQIQESKSFTGSPSYFLALRIGMIGSNAFIENPEARFEHRVIIGTPTEQALVHAASQAGIDQEELKKEYPRLEELPFDSEKKYMVTLNEDAHHRRILFIKGAPEIILDKAATLEVDGKEVTLRLSRRGKLTEEYKELSRQGLRLLAVGYKKVDKGYEKINQQDDLVTGMTIVGFMAMKDPLREDTRQTIELCQEAGIRPVMITGDHRLTAMAIAKELGLPSKEENVIEGAQFEKLNSKELKKQVENISVYARVNPQDKLRIVNALQSRGEVVAMTGDGVNDAPALKTADIGLALGSGTDVAKDTADIVLLDNNFKTIVRAVEEGRIIFDNIKKVILYLMSDSFTEIIIIGTSLFIGIIGTGSFPLPLLATQILWINLITDGFPNIALTLEPADRDVMKDKPVPLHQPIVTSHMWTLIAIVSLVTGIATLILYTLVYRATGDVDLARTIAFTAVAIDSLLYVFSIRSMRKSIWNKNFFTNPYLLVAIGMGFGLQLLAIYLPFFQRIFHTVPLTLAHWLDLLIVSLLAIMAIEISKMFFNRVKKHK